MKAQINPTKTTIQKFSKNTTVVHHLIPRAQDRFYLGRLISFCNMKLTNILFRFKPKLPGGNIYKGKYRLVKPVTGLTIARLRDEFEIEEKNMFYLRNPYLTVEQSRGHAAPFNHKQKFMEEKKEARLKWMSHKSLGDRFGFLKLSDKWE